MFAALESSLTLILVSVKSEVFIKKNSQMHIHIDKERI